MPTNSWKFWTCLFFINLFASPGVGQEFSFYGRLDYSLTYADHGSATHNGVAGFSFENNFTRLGIRGTEPLGPRWDFFYRVEVGVAAEDQDNARTPLTSRPTYIGLAGPYGRLAVGRIDPVLKMAKGFVDAFDNYSTKHDRLMAGDKRHGDSLEYKSPTWQGLKAGASLLLEDEYYAEADPRRDNGNYQLSVTSGDKFFSKQKLYLAAAYGDGIEDIRAARLVVQWKTGNWVLGCLVQDTKMVSPDAVANEDRDGRGVFVSAKYSLGSWLLKAQAGTDDSGSGLIARRIYSDLGDEALQVPKVTAWAVGCEYRFNKKIRLHAEWGEFRVENYRIYDDNIVSLGVRYDF